MSLMDAYGLSLVSVEVWGLMWGFLSTAFIIGGLVIAKRGLGKNPLRSLFIANLIIWSISSVFTIPQHIFVLVLGFMISVISGTELCAQMPVLSGKSLYADVRASNVGDIITLIINENTSATNENNAETNKQSDVSISSDAGTGKLDFIPGFGLTSANQNRFQGSAQISSQAALSTTISTRVVKILENGYFMIEGVREVETNGEKVTLTATGIVRPVDVATNNTIKSSQVAELQVFLTGKGVATDGNRPGIFTRILNWIF